MPEPRNLSDPWPALPFSAWSDTCQTLQLWMQIAGKISLKLRPFLNEWWQIAFHLTPRGLTTGTMPLTDRIVFSINFDFIDHSVKIIASDGRRAALPLSPRTVARFYREMMEALGGLGIAVSIDPRPREIPGAIPCDTDEIHSSYDPASVRNWWQIMLSTEQVIERFRSDFVGKSSPIHFFWGSFDLNHTRFSGKPATPPKGAPRFVQLGEDQENFSCGFWPGNTTMSGITLGRPAFYSYIYPEPPGFKEARAVPTGAAYDPRLGEFILPLDEVRRSDDPAGTLLQFFQSTYDAAAESAHWDRARLERRL
jgi:hypothetical protein